MLLLCTLDAGPGGHTTGGLLTAGMIASIVIKRPYRLFRTLWISLHPQLSGNPSRPLTQMYDRRAVRRVTIATPIGSLDTQHMLAVADRQPRHSLRHSFCMLGLFIAMSRTQ